MSILFLFSLSQAHCHYAVLNAFQSALQTAKVNDNNLAILRALCSLYGVFGIIQYSGEFTMVTNYTQEAVPLVDAFDFHDQILNSALGRYDGDVYRHLYELGFESTKKQNRSTVNKHQDNYNNYI